MKAILIDDEFYALEGMKIELCDIDGIEVVGAYETVKEALEKLDETDPDIVFLDIEMPEMKGLEAFRKLIELKDDLKIIFVTAYNEYAVEAFELNAMDYILKPIVKSRILQTLARIEPLLYSEKPSKSISIKCFGEFMVMADGEKQNNYWRTKKAEELLAYLLCERGNFILKEKLAEELWPELDSEKGISNLYLAYFYLKKQYQIKGLIFPVESVTGKMRICLENIDCDLIKFHNSIDSLRIIDKNNVNKAEKIVELYNGKLFQDKSYTWADALRIKYEVSYAELLQNLVDYHMNKGNIDKFQYYIKRKRNSV